MHLRPVTAIAVIAAAIGLLSVMPTGGRNAPDGPLQAAPITASAGSTPRECALNQLGGAEPRMQASAPVQIQRLCSPHLAIGHSPVTRTPLWVAERLTPQRSREGSDTARVSEFYPDPRLPRQHRAELGDYRASGYDRGHLAPSADMPGLDAQRESFSLANIAPQNAELNRGAWADLEIDLRQFALMQAETFVVTGLLFEGQRVQTTPTGRVYVPTSFWKAVTVPGRGSVVYVAENSERGAPVPMSLPAFVSRYRIDPFPALDANTRAMTIEVQ